MNKIVVDVVKILENEEIYGLSETDFSGNGILNFSTLFTSKDTTEECLKIVKKRAELMGIETVVRWHYPTGKQEVQ